MWQWAQRKKIEQMKTYFHISVRVMQSKELSMLHLRSSSLDDGRLRQYQYFALPQHILIGLSSQWNLGRKSISTPCFFPSSSSNDGALGKSGCWYRIHQQQQQGFKTVSLHLNFLHSAWTLLISPKPRSSKMTAIPLKTPLGAWPSGK